MLMTDKHIRDIAAEKVVGNVPDRRPISAEEASHVVTGTKRDAGNSERDDSFRMGMDNGSDIVMSLVDLGMNAALDIAFRSTLFNRLSVFDPVLNQIVLRGDGGRGHVLGHNKYLWPEWMSEREVPVCIDHAMVVKNMTSLNELADRTLHDRSGFCACHCCCGHCCISRITGAEDGLGDHLTGPSVRRRHTGYKISRIPLETQSHTGVRGITVTQVDLRLGILVSWWWEYRAS